MLVFIFFGTILYAFIKFTNIEKIREYLFSLTIIFCLFFFSSNEPIFGIQLYIYSMLLSIALSIFSCKKVNKNVFLSTVILFSCLAIPIFEIAMGSINQKYLILKTSNTDVMNINSELRVPTFNFTIFKHFMYFFIYILFVVLNADLYRSELFLSKIIAKVCAIFKILISLIIVEWSIVNILGGYNDRSLMDFIFSLNGVNQKTNWYGWGSYNVALWFTERSNFFIIAIYYLILLNKNDISRKDWKWIILSAVACYCTGSSSALVIFVLYILLQGSIIIFKTRRVKTYLIYSVVFLFAAITLYKFYPVFSPKILSFINNKSEWSSSHFRMQSIEYGLKAFASRPFLGVGIGTVFAHSMLVQTLSNIGLIGLYFTLYIHQKVCPICLNKFQKIVGIFFFIFISFGTFMFQHFSSPIIITFFLISHMKGEILNARADS